MSIWRKFLPITIACILTGMLLSSAFRAQTALNAENKTNRNQTLIDIIDNLETETNELEENIDILKKEIEQLQQKEIPGQEGYVAGLQDQIQQLKLRSDQIAVAGPGILVLLDDNTTGAEAAKINNPEFYNPEDFIVHDKSLLYLVNALKGNAEAIAINNQRISYNSDIRCVGTVIMVNSSRLAPPYEIKAIGSPSVLEAAILNSDEYLFLKSKEIPLTITKTEKIDLPGIKGNYSVSYTEEVKEGEKSKKQKEKGDV